MSMFKVVEPAYKHGIKVFYYRFHAITTRPFGLASDASLLTLADFSFSPSVYPPQTGNPEIQNLNLLPNNYPHGFCLDARSSPCH